MGRIKVLSSKHLAYKINAKDHNPPHVHVEGMGASLRVNLLTLEVMGETDFTERTVKLIMLKVAENRELLLEEWEKYHGKD